MFCKPKQSPPKILLSTLPSIIFHCLFKIKIIWIQTNSRSITINSKYPNNSLAITCKQKYCQRYRSWLLFSVHLVRQGFFIQAFHNGQWDSLMHHTCYLLSLIDFMGSFCLGTASLMTVHSMMVIKKICLFVCFPIS